MNLSKLLIFFLLIIPFNACRYKLSPNDYVQWIENPKNGFNQIQKAGSYTINVKYLPTAYRIIKDNMEFTPDAVEQLDELYHFVLEVKPLQSDHDLVSLSGTDDKVIRDRKDYFYFQFEKDISLIIHDKSYKSCLYHMENTYNMKNSRTFLIAFEKEIPDKETVNLEIKSDLISHEKINFIFNLNKEPEIIL